MGVALGQTLSNPTLRGISGQARQRPNYNPPTAADGARTNMTPKIMERRST